MGKDLDFCLDIFQYEEKPVEVIREQQRLNPILLEFGTHFQLEQLVGPEISSSFKVQRLSLETKRGSLALPGEIPQVVFVTKGMVHCIHRDEEVGLKLGESLFVAAAANHLKVVAGSQAELCLVMPG
jgi:mannose-6-phosphate isomerase